MLYEYQNDETGLVAVVNRPVADRNKPLVLTFERRPVPSSMNRVGARLPEVTTGDRVLEGYRHAEQKPGGLRSEFSAKEIKQIWNQPTP